MSIPSHEARAPTHTRMLPSGGLIAEHWHDDNQIVYAGTGVVSVTTSAGTWVAPGTRAIWIPAGTVHAHQAHCSLRMNFVGLPCETNPLDLHRPTVLTVGPLLRELLIAYTDGRALDTDAAARMRAVILDQLELSHQGPLHLPSSENPLLVGIRRRFEADPATQDTLAQLGHAAGASPRTLSRLFSAELGLTFSQWRTHFRLHRALIALAAGATVTTTALTCGWSSPSAFIAAFHRVFGYTPGAGPHPR